MSSKWSKALTVLALACLAICLGSLVVQFMAGATTGLSPGGPLQNPSVEVRTGLLNADSLFLPGMFDDIFAKGGQFADWYRPRASFFFPDYAIFGVAYWLSPDLFGQVMLYGLIQTLLVVAAVWLIARAAVGTHVAATTALVSGVLIWLALNAGQPFVYILASVFHYGAFLVSLFVVGLWLLLRDPARRRWHPLLYAAMAALVFAGTVSNSMFLILCVVPLAGTVVAEVLLTRRLSWRQLLPLVCVLAAGVLGYVVDTKMAGPGGHFSGVIDPTKFAYNFEYSIGLFGNAVAAWPPLALLWLMYAGIVAFSIVRIAQRDDAHRGAHWLALYSFMSAACALSVFTLITYLWPPQSRYFTAAMTWPVIVIGVFVASHWQRAVVPLAAAGTAATALSIGVTTYAMAKGHDLGTHYTLAENTCIDNALEGTGLRNGVANYWDARVIQLPSRLDLNIAQYSRDFYAMHWITSKRYFKRRYDFAIISDYDPGDKIDVQAMLRLNGEPERVVSCGVSKLYVYGKDRLRIEKFDAAGDAYRWKGCELATTGLGEKTPSCHMRKPDPKPAGVLTFGPYAAVPEGRYAFELQYASAADGARTVADWDVMLAGSPESRQLARGQMTGTGGGDRVVRGEFTVDRQGAGKQIEIRTLAHADAPLEVIGLRVERVQ